MKKIDVDKYMNEERSDYYPSKKKKKLRREKQVREKFNKRNEQKDIY